MNHDTPERGCGCRMTVDRGGCIMTPSTGWVTASVLTIKGQQLFKSSDPFLIAAISHDSGRFILANRPSSAWGHTSSSAAWVHCSVFSSALKMPSTSEIIQSACHHDVKHSLSLHSFSHLIKRANVTQKSPYCWSCKYYSTCTSFKIDCFAVRK